MRKLLRPLQLAQCITRRNMAIMECHVTDFASGYDLSKKKTQHARCKHSVKIYDMPRALLDFINDEHTALEKEQKREAVEFNQRLFARRPKIEQEDYDARKVETLELLLKKGKLSHKQISEMSTKEMTLIAKTLNSRMHHWEPIDYDALKARYYLLARSTPDYATLCNVFGEIAKKDPDFEPKTVFDFGSGVGTVTWALDRMFPNKSKEVLSCDISTHMHELNEQVLASVATDMPNLPKVQYREHLPTSNAIQYDLVVCSRTLLEVGDMAARCRVSDVLWRKVSENGYLVFVENGTAFGSTLVIEARDYLLQMNASEKDKGNYTPLHIVAPCPHDSACPRFQLEDYSKCNFRTKYFNGSHHSLDVYSYVVLQKKERPQVHHLPRIISKIKGSGGTKTCYLCVKEGKVAHAVVRKKECKTGSVLVVRRSSWGDLFPFQYELKEKQPREPQQIGTLL